ncbi:MAG: hypothetical protein ABIG96_02415 [Candidatus Micrarchaeota archaeon]
MGLKKHIRRSVPRHRGKTETALKASIVPHDAEMELLKNIVMKRHREWRKPKRTHYWPYLAVLAIISYGCYLLVNPEHQLTGLSQALVFISTLILTTTFLFLLATRMKETSFTRLEENVENEILSMRIEKAAKR